MLADVTQADSWKSAWVIGLACLYFSYLHGKDIPGLAHWSQEEDEGSLNQSNSSKDKSYSRQTQSRAEPLADPEMYEQTQPRVTKPLSHYLWTIILCNYHIKLLSFG